jgi:hypothetical protein
MADYPGAVKTFTTKVTSDVIEAAHVNDIQSEVTAVENALLNGLAHDLKPTATDTHDLGTSDSLRWLTIFAYITQAIEVRLKEYPSSVEGNNYVTITLDEALAANRTLKVTLGDASRTLAITGNVTISQNYSTSGTPQFAQLGLGAAISTGALLNIGGTFTGVGAGLGIAVQPTINVPANSVGALISTAGTLVEAGSGTHALLAGARITIPTVTGAGGAVTDTAALYVEGPMTATVTGANYAVWVDAGNTRLDGGFRTTAVATSSLTTGDNNNLAPTGLSTAAQIDCTPFAGGSNITGITAQPAGTRLLISNLSSADNVILLADNAGSTAANRFAASTVNTTIIPGHVLEIVYNATLSRWQIFQS